MITVTAVALIRFRPKHFRPPLQMFAANLKEHNASRVYKQRINIQIEKPHPLHCHQSDRPASLPPPSESELKT